MRYIITLFTFFIICSINAQETRLIKDINVIKSVYSNVSELTNYKDKIYFTAESFEYGNELWISDGTAEGTKLFADIRTGSRSANPRELTVFNGKLYFKARNNVYGEELWVTDGTVGGTKLIKDIFPGEMSSFIYDIVTYNNKLYFRANDGAHGYELWESDGTEAGTKLAVDIYDGSASSQPSDLIVFKDKLFFRVYDPVYGSELWESDGTKAGTKLFKDIVPGITGAYPTEFCVFNNELFFQASDGVNGIEMWKTDGTTAGTKMVVDIVSGRASSFPRNFIVLKDKMYFSADDGVKGDELWESDGTAAGTKLFKDVYEGERNSSYPSNFLVLNDELYFSVYSLDFKVNIWKTDGTIQGTKYVLGASDGERSLNPTDLMGYKGQLFFSGSDNDSQKDLWKYNVDNFQAEKISTIDKGTGNSTPRNLFVYKDKLFFNARDGVIGNEMWVSDGTEAGTKLFKDINMSGSSSPRNFIEYKNKLYFNAIDETYGSELWESDGTEAGTKMIVDINPGTSGSNIGEIVEFQNKIYFSATDGINGYELWESDGTVLGTKMVANIMPGANGSSPQNLTVYNGKLYFNAYYSDSGTELWVSDGTAAGTKLFKDISLGINSSSPSYLTVYNNKLYFSASDGVNGTELWETDGTAGGTKQVKDIATSIDYASPSYLTVYNNKLYFRANDGVHGGEIWESDGTAEGTKLLKDIRAGSNGSYPSYLKVFNNKLYFRANDGVHGSELWETDGTASGTVLVADIDKRTNSSSSVADLTVYKDRLYFKADDGIHNDELYVFIPFDCGTINTNRLYVSTDGFEKNDGSSWNSTTTLQQALKRARSCSGIQEIWIKKGAYLPGQERINTFTIPSDVKIYGGFSGDETALNQRDIFNNQTVLNGELGLPGNSGNVITVLKIENTNNVVIDGVVIDGGNANVTINSFVEDDTLGGGVYLKNSSNTIFSNCIFKNNSAIEGAAAYHESGNNNSYINCLFYNNTATVSNIVFSKTGTLAFTNCTMVNNTVPLAFGIIGSNESMVVLNNSILEGNHTVNFNTTNTGSLIVNYSYLKGENPTGQNNIDATQITDVVFKDALNNDYNLLKNSPLVDKGNNDFNDVLKDLSGNNRVYDGDIDMIATIDIGAYEFTRKKQTITFNTLNDVVYGASAFDLEATSNSGLAVSYASSNADVASVTGKTITINGVGTTTITASQLGDANYESATAVNQTLTVTPRAITVIANSGQTKVYNTVDPILIYTITSGSLVTGDALTGNIERVSGVDVGMYAITQGSLSNSNYEITFVSSDFEITKASQTITFNALNDVVYGAPVFDLEVTTNSGLAVSYISSNADVASVTGKTITVNGVGTTTITASQLGNANYESATAVSQTLTVTPRAITITADSGQTKVYNTVDPTLTYTITSGSLVTGDALIGNIERVSGEDAGMYAITQGSLSNSNYEITFVSSDFEITKASQTITFNALNDVVYGASAFDLETTTNSGLAVSYTSLNADVASVAGKTITINGVGTTTITASQLGDANYESATAVSQTLTVTPRAITITADSGQTKVYNTVDPILTYTITSGSLVTGDVLTGNIERVSGEDAGVYAITQGSLSNSNYEITFVSSDFEITKATQIITFNVLNDVVYGASAFDLEATTNSGLAVSYASSNADVASVTGKTITVNGVGTTTITASQLGDANYESATAVSQTLTVTPRAITITADSGQTKVYNTVDPTLTYTITSGSFVTGDVLTGNVERISGEDAGMYAITQGSLSNSNYEITFVSSDFEITKASQTITFNALNDVVYGASAFDLEATTNSGLSVSYTSLNANVASVTGKAITINGVGTTTITASQLGNANYESATAVSQTLTVTPRAITITADSGQTKVYNTVDPTLTYTITSGSLIDGDVLTGNIERVSGEDAGMYAITQGSLSNSNYEISFVSSDFEITKATQTITFNALNDVVYGASTFDLEATTNSGLAVSYTSSNANVASVIGKTITINGVGTTTITASQLGNANYESATAVSQTLTVTPRTITITADSGQTKVYNTVDPTLTYTITSGSLVAGDALTGNIERVSGEDAGMYAITQGSLSNSNYEITFVSSNFEITKASQIITFNTLNDVVQGSDSFELIAEATSGLPITFTSLRPTIAKVSGTTVVVLGDGQVAIIATQEGNKNYHPATPVHQVLTVNSIRDLKIKVRLYPNPTTNDIALTEIPVKSNVFIYSFKGVLLKQVKGYEKEETIDVSMFSSGVYILKIQIPNLQGAIVKKFIKR